MKLLLLAAFSLFTSTLVAQPGKKKTPTPASNNSIERPKLVVGFVVDQMRWDFLYRYYDRYQPNGGFKRILSQGNSCENTFIPYTPTVTAAGHTCLYTGSVPAIHGITGNTWYDNLQQRNVYCSEDNTVIGVGSNNNNGKMSPRNMLTTTIADELRLATNFRNKVIGIALKDRGAILPAGHSANAAYWYDGTNGIFISSTYYMQQLPPWVQQFNQRSLVDSFYKTPWNTLYPIETYLQSAKDKQPYEALPFGKNLDQFPYDLSANIGKNYWNIASTPYGNTLTFEMAKSAVLHEQLGQSGFTDMLCVSLSSTDYIGHAFGPNSIETEDTYLRLDQELGAFLNFLDAQVGKGNYLFFLSADHGVAHVPGFLQANKLPGGIYDDTKAMKAMNDSLKAIFGIDQLIVSDYNYQITLNEQKLDSAHLKLEDVTSWIIKYLRKQPAIANAFAIDEMMKTPLNEKQKSMLANGYFPTRCGHIQVILKPGYVEGKNTGTTHGIWNPYDSHIPLVWYGWGVKPGVTRRETHMTDAAATIATMLRIQMPNGCVGNTITEIINNP
ncbi:MAG: alkaline phosphatase PafA [Chitinophagaceae bacterium]